MIKVACGKRECWPIIVTSTKLPTPETTTQTEVSVISLQNNQLETIFVISAGTVAFILLVIVAIPWRILSRISHRGEP